MDDGSLTITPPSCGCYGDMNGMGASRRKTDGGEDKGVLEVGISHKHQQNANSLPTRASKWLIEEADLMAVEKLVSSTFLFLMTTSWLVLDRCYLGQYFSDFNVPMNYLDITSFKSRFSIYRSRKGSETSFLWSSQVLALHGGLSSKVFWTCCIY